MKHDMKINKFKAPNPQWDITDFTCDKTGISIQKHTMNIEPFLLLLSVFCKSESVSCFIDLSISWSALIDSRYFLNPIIAT